MIKRFGLAIALGLMVALSGAVPAQAGNGAGDIIKSVGVIDCTPQGISWTPWKYVGPNNAGAGKICGPEGVCCANVRTLDNAADGHCISIFYKYSEGGLIYRHIPTTACGYGIVKAATMPGAVHTVYVGRHPTGTTGWGDVVGWRYLCWPSDACA